MGLDWMVDEKQDGTHPMETAGALKIDPFNNESVKAFRAIYDENVAKLDPETNNEHFYAFWSRPFETVLNDESVKGKYLGDTIPEDSPALAAFGGLFTSPVDFRGKMITCMGGLPGELREEAFADKDPDEAVDYADRLEACESEVDEDHRPILRQAVAWLRYWGGEGHPIFAWF